MTGGQHQGEVRPAVVAAGERPTTPLLGDAGTVSVRIDTASVGARNLTQRVIQVAAGGTVEQHHPRSEDVIYVVAGAGEAVVGNHTIALEPGIAFFAPADRPYRLDADQPLELVSVLAPPPGSTHQLAAADAIEDGRPWVREIDQDVIAAGSDAAQGYMDRHFRLLVDPDHGAHYVTQFVGTIETSKAPPHTHGYDEVIYILGGRGFVHIDGDRHSISARSSVFLPPGSWHCLENPGPEPLRLLGVFCPAGSPKARQDQEPEEGPRRDTV